MTKQELYVVVKKFVTLGMLDPAISPFKIMCNESTPINDTQVSNSC